ncbi:MAG: hypothetical protein JXR96_27735 [Deltaproteobacteria bacterium]|nr:hypothetical protein [Deltaproteobacteria bacterium]
MSALAALISLSGLLDLASEAEVRMRMDADAAAGRPLVAHVIVALCDNVHQGIVPVKARLGNGRDPANNLYWGALYGVKRFFTSEAGWRRIRVESGAAPIPEGVLERAVLHKRLVRGDKPIDAYVVAEAWEGSRIEKATARFLRLAAGERAERLAVRRGKGRIELLTGGHSHLIVYTGHDGLMDFEPPVRPEQASGAPARSVAILACLSREYFEALLARAGAHPLLLTCSLMPPEAYTSAALIDSWFGGASEERARERAARAFARYQKCSRDAARRIFCITRRPPGSAPASVRAP